MRALASILGVVPVVVVLSIIVWIVMYYAFPDAPLTPTETALVVFVFTVLTATVRGWRKRVDRPEGEKADGPSHESSNDSSH